MEGVKSIMFDSLDEYLKQVTLEEKEQSKYHIHAWNREGASNAMGCNHLKALRKNRFELPKLSPFKESGKQVFRMGHMVHEEIQETLQKAFQNNPDIQYEAECLIEVAIPGTDIIIESPIDSAYFKRDPNNIELITHQYGPFELITKKITPTGLKNLLQIEDIKTESDYAYADAYESHFSAANLGQFHIYMYGAGMSELVAIAIRKSDYAIISRVIPWNQEIWNTTVAGLLKYQQLRDVYKLYATEPYQSIPVMDGENYACLRNGIEWWGCPLSQTEVFEKSYPKHKQSQFLRYPCPQAAEYMQTHAKEHFSVGQTWKRKEMNARPKDVIIRDITDSKIISEQILKTKKGAIFEDDFVTAWICYTQAESEE
jgi:hypothetical protein